MSNTPGIQQLITPLEQIVEATGADLFLLDPEYTICWANKNIIERFGCSEQIIGRLCYTAYCNFN